MKSTNLHASLQRRLTVKEIHVFMASVMEIDVSASLIMWEKIAASSNNKVDLIVLSSVKYEMVVPFD